MSFRLKILVVAVAGFFLELVSFKMAVGAWMSLGWGDSIAQACANMGFERVAYYFGLIWSRVPEWAMALAGGIAIAAMCRRDRFAAAVTWGLGLMVGGYVAPALESYRASYEIWSVKFLLAYWVLGTGSLVLACLGEWLGGWIFRRGEES